MMINHAIPLAVGTTAPRPNILSPKGLPAYTRDRRIKILDTPNRGTVVPAITAASPGAAAVTPPTFERVRSIRIPVIMVAST
ncbi:MAG TPA: hypothetical protein VH500_05885 [Nitrososphaeraceae archaeon]